MATEGICPKCGSSDLDYGVMSAEDSNLVKYPVSCNHCEFCGYEYYLLTYNATTDEQGHDL